MGKRGSNIYGANSKLGILKWPVSVLFEVAPLCLIEAVFETVNPQGECQRLCNIIVIFK